MSEEMQQECMTCGAHPGRKCTDAITGKVTNWPHYARTRAAEDSREKVSA